ARIPNDSVVPDLGPTASGLSQGVSGQISSRFSPPEPSSQRKNPGEVAGVLFVRGRADHATSAGMRRRSRAGSSGGHSDRPRAAASSSTATFSAEPGSADVGADGSTMRPLKSATPRRANLLVDGNISRTPGV